MKSRLSEVNDLFFKDAAVKYGRRPSEKFRSFSALPPIRLGKSAYREVTEIER
jgi:hypothetical protein